MIVDVVYHRVSLLPTFKGLGISLTPNGIISAIEPNSPSDRAGLRKDNRIVEVNGIDVRDRSNKEIAKIIKENEANLVIGVLETNLDRDSYPVHSSSHSNLKNIISDIVAIPAVPVNSALASNTPSTSYRPVSDGSSNLKSIMGEAIETRPVQTPAYVSPSPSQSMSNIKAILADVIQMQAPPSTSIGPSSQRAAGLNTIILFVVPIFEFNVDLRDQNRLLNYKICFLINESLVINNNKNDEII